MTKKKRHNWAVTYKPEKPVDEYAQLPEVSKAAGLRRRKLQELQEALALQRELDDLLDE